METGIAVGVAGRHASLSLCPHCIDRTSTVFRVAIVWRQIPVKVIDTWASMHTYR